MRFNLRLLAPVFAGLIASLVLLPSVHAQGVAPYVSLWLNGAPVSTSNPLPVTGAGGGGSPLPTFSASLPVTVATPAGAVNIACAACVSTTPSPSATATATAGAGSVTWSGSWPYTLSVNFPVTSATTAPNVLLKSSNSTWDAVVLAESSATHVYPMNDASGCHTVADAVGGGATAVPSPVPLPTPTTANIVCGAPTISHDGETSVEFPGNSSEGYLIIPSSVLPASGAFSLEFLLKPALTGVANIGSGNAADFFFSMDTIPTHLRFGYKQGATFTSNDMEINSNEFSGDDVAATGVPIFFMYTWDGTHTNVYINCDDILQNTTAPAFNNGNSGTLGVEFSSGSPLDPYYGRISKFATHNTALSQTTCFTHLAALGL